MTDIVSSFTGFLDNHANDLNTIAGALSTIVGALPLDSQDKSIVTEGISSLEGAATAIREFLAGNPLSVGSVTVKESDIENAVKNVLSTWGYGEKPSVPTPAETPTPAMEGTRNVENPQ